MTRVVLLLFCTPLSLLAPGGEAPEPGPAFEEALATIREEDVERDVRFLAAPELLGRDSPSVGLARAADFVEERLRAAGMVGGAADGTFRHRFAREMTEPDPAGCALSYTRGSEAAVRLELGRDFVPLARCTGRAAGEVVFVGFGISSRKDRYDDLKRAKVRGRVAMFVEGEPRHPKLFDGPDEVTAAADVHEKVDALIEEGAVGVLVVRRPPVPPTDPELGLEPLAMGFRYTFARWVPTKMKPMVGRPRTLEIPALEVGAETASALLGVDVLALARAIEKSGKPRSHAPGNVRVDLASALRVGNVSMDNVVGVLKGTDPELADEYVVIGAHYDHLGVDVYGRIAYGADDNASGTSAMIEVVEALARAGTRRSVLACAFAAEEDGLLGSGALVDDPPVPLDSMVAMINLDMVGHGDPGTVVVLGPKYSPDLGKAVKAAKRLADTGIEKLLLNRAEHLWERSDQLHFHENDIPSLFFFESPSEADNPHYHTFRDTVDKVSFDKVCRTARLVFGTAWLVANGDERPRKARR